MTRILCIVAGILAFAAGASAQTQQQVAFIGDYGTVVFSQQPQFQAHPNWIADGSDNGQPFESVLSKLQTIIASGKKPIIHLLMGQFQPLTSPGNPHASIFAYWASTFDEIITTAQKAKLTIIVGTIPFSGPPGDVSDMNKWIFAYCAQHSIPVINYDYALNSGMGFSAFGASAPSMQPGTLALPAPEYYQQGSGGYATNAAPTSQAWDVMADMAQTAIILAEGYKLKSGFLNTVVFNGNNVTDFEDYPTANSNQVQDGGYVQFTAYGQYTDGSTHIMNNADVNGHTGVWTNSNPLALSLDQTGAARALDTGSTNVHFTTLSGMTINEWVMNTNVVIINCLGCPTSF